MGRGALNPKNAAPELPSKFGFQEGFIRVDKSVFKVHQNKAPENPQPGYVQPQPYTALVWNVTRLNEELQPLTDEQDNGLHEELVFGLGGKSLLSVHPGNISGPEDEEAEDLGVELNTEGNTIFFANPDFKIHPKSGVMILIQSILKQKPALEDVIDRQFASDYDGCVFHMKSWADDSKDAIMQTYKDKKTGLDVSKPTAYKIVDKVVKGPGEAKKAKSGGGAAAGANGNGDVKVEGKLKEAIAALLSKHDGTECTFKLFAQRVNTWLQTSKVEPKLLVPVTNMAKDTAWVGKHAEECGIKVTETGVIFGELSE